MCAIVKMIAGVVHVSQGLHLARLIVKLGETEIETRTRRRIMAGIQGAVEALTTTAGTETEKAMGMNDATDKGEARLSLRGIVMMTVQQKRRAKMLLGETGERKWQVVDMRRSGIKAPTEIQNLNG